MQEEYFHHLLTWKDGHVCIREAPFSDSLLCLLCLAFRFFFSAGKYKVVADFVFCCTTTVDRRKGKQMCRVARRRIYSELQHHGTSTMALLPSSFIPLLQAWGIDQILQEMTSSCFVLKHSVLFNFGPFTAPQKSVNVFKEWLWNGCNMENSSGKSA